KCEQNGESGLYSTAFVSIQVVHFRNVQRTRQEIPMIKGKNEANQKIGSAPPSVTVSIRTSRAPTIVAVRPKPKLKRGRREARKMPAAAPTAGNIQTAANIVYSGPKSSASIMLFGSILTLGLSG